jgi:uridine kinase
VLIKTNNRLIIQKLSVKRDIMQPRMIIGIAGGTGSGKTEIADRLVAQYGEANCLRISSDNYYKGLGIEDLAAEYNFDDPKSIEFELLITHLKKLKNPIEENESISIPTYNFKTHSREPQEIKIHPKPIIIVEGILIFHPQALKALFDMTVFVDAHEYIRVFRRLSRDMVERGRTYEGSRDQYLKTVGPADKEFVQPTKAGADVVITNNSNDFTIDIQPAINHIEKLDPALRFFVQQKQPVSMLYPSTSVNGNATGLHSDSSPQPAPVSAFSLSPG